MFAAFSGGFVVDSIETSTVLVTSCVKRSQKLLSAVGMSKPICSPKWLQDSKKANKFLGVFTLQKNIFYSINKHNYIPRCYWIIFRSLGLHIRR